MHRIRRSRALIAILVALTASTAVALPTVADLNLILGEAAQVAYTNGDGVNVRDNLGFNSNVITALGEGVEVIVHDGPVAANDGSYWYYVSSGGVEGWVIADFLALPGAQSSGAATMTAEIAFTGGDGVNVRASSSLDSGIVTTLHEGTTVAIVAGPEWDGAGTPWTLINFEGVEGWIVDDFLAWHDTTGSSGSEVQQVSDAWTAYVVDTGGGLRLRDAASTDSNTLVVMPDGAAVTVYATQIYGPDGAEWWNIEYEGIVGYAAAYYLSGDAPAAPAAEQPAAEEPVEVAEESGDELQVWAGANAEVVSGGDYVNLRYEWGYNSGVAASLEPGTIVWVIEGPVWGGDGSPWFQVDASGTVGWMHGNFLVYTEQAPGSGAEVAVADTGPEAAVSNDPLGSSIVGEALNYVGLPYVWGGTTPAGFDCSGFVHYVLSNVFGYNFTRSLEVQATSGSHVDPANLMPGDLVFFQNTYTWGLSHVGIYIGDGQFVHAGSERTGVTITSMSDSYWSSRYYTARRVRA